MKSLITPNRSWWASIKIEYCTLDHFILIDSLLKHYEDLLPIYICQQIKQNSYIIYLLQARLWLVFLVGSLWKSSSL